MCKTRGSISGLLAAEEYHATDRFFGKVKLHVGQKIAVRNVHKPVHSNLKNKRVATPCKTCNYMFYFFLLDLNLSIHNNIVSTKIYDKRDDFNFDIVNFPFLDGDVPRRPSYGVYISQLIRFARASSHALLTSIIVTNS